MKLSLPGQQGWGTGFFVAPGWILTCAHVVRQAADRPVTVFYQEQHLSAMVKKIADDGKTLDLALIELSEPLSNHPCVLLDLHKEPVANGEKLYAYGYLSSYPHAAPVHLVNEGLTGDQPPLLKLKQAQIESGISGAALLNLRSRQVCGMVKETRNANFDLGGGAIPTRVILEQFPELRERQQAFHESDKRWLNLLAPQAKIDFQPYLKSIRDDEDYQEGQEVYTPTTLEDRRPVRGRETAKPGQRRFSSRLKLRVETVKRDQQGQEYPPDESQEGKEQVKQWDVLEGLRQYATDHVVLIGKPGSGKSTSLERLLWEEAERALHDAKARIPVLLKLRNCRSSIEQLIRDFLIGHQVTLERQDIEELLGQGKFLLLLDGLNELPESFRTEIKNFRDRYHRTTAMIVSTRDLSLGGTLGIEKTLRMLPLTKGQMREFVRGYLGEEGDRLFQQLQGDRLRKFAETPLLLWMLCRVFAQSGQVPRNLGLAFREFAKLHDQEIQEDAATDSREQWPKLLRHLAFVMMQGKTPKDLRLSIPREEAEDCLTEYLQQKGRANPRGCAEHWLKDLLKYHLIQPVMQPNFEEHLEFRHQLIQEYYAAESLLRRLPHLSDEELKRDYLNYLKWTEPVALMLALLDEEATALRVVRLAMDEVDLILGARLAGEVKPYFQYATVGLIDEKELPLKLKVQCWEASHSEQAVKELLVALKDSDKDVRRRAAWALGEIGSEQAVEGLRNARNDPDISVRRRATWALGKIRSEQEVEGPRNAFNDPGKVVHSKPTTTLEQIVSGQAVEELLPTLKHPDISKRKSAAYALGKIGSQQAVEGLLTALKDSDISVRASAALSS
ncbi:HEAT repeat domain-containing protein [Sodalinema gerasimenkoae]|uniref:HEAT repeat domain-containing protein n=1 Tax=Sodalinema gerasimenkoae TaxID=2862348 RepID=UPI0013573313|nr:HEAT repeat domain-containing protein [Sodalinema gerasimenkoae]